MCVINHELPDRVPVIPQDAQVAAYLAGLEVGVWSDINEIEKLPRATRGSFFHLLLFESISVYYLKNSKSSYHPAIEGGLTFMMFDVCYMIPVSSARTTPPATTLPS